MDTASWVGFVLAHPPVWVWQVQYNKNMVKWLSNPTEAQKRAACFPNQAWQCTEPAQVGLGCVPRTRSEGSRVGRWRLAPQWSLAEFSRAHWLQVRASLPGRAPGRALVPLQINSPRVVSKGRERLLSWLWPSSVVPKSPTITQCPIPGIIQLTVLARKHRNHKAAALAFLL